MCPRRFDGGLRDFDGGIGITAPHRGNQGAMAEANGRQVAWAEMPGHRRHQRPGPVERIRRFGIGGDVVDVLEEQIVGNAVLFERGGAVHGIFIALELIDIGLAGPLDETADQQAEHRPAQIAQIVQQRLVEDALPWGPLMAGAVLSSVPLMILYFIAQRFMVQGMTAGSVKG